VVERIAAGEVIERPASVVRELIENALDARATAIRVELRAGGMGLVRVADDGIGIPPEELELAAAPHATSKLRDAGDLERIRTLGFRGEALASMAAVAELTVSSAADAGGVAHTLTLRPGHGDERTLDARTRGTTVTVRDLFHNVPARHALLRGPRGEVARALAVARAYALLHAGVRFTVIVEKAIAFQTPGTSPEAAVGAIYGEDVARRMAAIGPIALDRAEIRGWIAPRALSQADRRSVVLGVNGRPAGNRGLLAALEAGYRPLLRKGRHPIAVVAFEVDPEALDVNVHPAKAEVLVRAERALGAALREATHAALGAAPVTVEFGPAASGGIYARAQALRLPAVRRHRARLGEPRGSYGPGGADDDGETAPGTLPPLEPLGQLDDALIVARAPEGQLYLVDQHRAHERLLYEALRRETAAADGAASGGGPEPGNDAEHGSARGQLLLEPLLVEVTPRQAEILRARLAELEALGLVCEPFGGATFILRALPALPGAAVGPVAFARDLAGDAAEDADDWLEHLRIALACRSAVRRGQALTLPEQRALLRDLRGATSPALCPHGSPILLRYTRGFLARAFEW
jgi:DNA mismatch repair protein MutL